MMRYTRKMLHKFSKEQLIDIILLQQEETATLKQQVATLRKENTQLRARVAELERVVNMNSRNSSKPPSSDPPHVDKSRKSRKSKRKRGGQPGHKGHCRKLLPEDQVDEITMVKPGWCGECGRKLKGESAWYERHQVWEIPEIKPHVHEYQLYGLCCDGCGAWNTTSLPKGIPTGAFGPRLQATIGILSGVYRLSKRSVQSVLEDFFNIPIGLGSVCACERLVSAALAEPVAEAFKHVQAAKVLHADETGWREYNRKAWMWVAVCDVATVFMIHTKRGQVAARELLGTFGGTLVTDRWGGYNFYKGFRQWCWAHLRRDFTAFSEYPGRAGEIGEELLEHCDQMFQWWHRVRDGTLKRSTLRQYMRRLRADVEELLREGACCGHEKMQGSCKRLVKEAKHLWTFVNIEGVEPTNNTAERAIRPAVLWRKGSFGTHSDHGSRFVERTMSVAATCRQQDRNITEFITQACQAKLHDSPAPSLLPTSV